MIVMIMIMIFVMIMIIMLSALHSALFLAVFQYDPGFQDDPTQPPFSESDEDEPHDTDGK